MKWHSIVCYMNMRILISVSRAQDKGNSRDPWFGGSLRLYDLLDELQPSTRRVGTGSRARKLLPTTRKEKQNFLQRELCCGLPVIPVVAVTARTYQKS